LASTSSSGASLTPSHPSLSLPLLSSPSPLPLISSPLSLPPSPLSPSLSLSSSLSPSYLFLTHTHDCLYESSDFSTQIDALILCVCVCLCVLVRVCDFACHIQSLDLTQECVFPKECHHMFEFI
jgi:hypothetical protein